MEQQRNQKQSEKCFLKHYFNMNIELYANDLLFDKSSKRNNY